MASIGLGYATELTLPAFRWPCSPRRKSEMKMTTAPALSRQPGAGAGACKLSSLPACSLRKSSLSTCRWTVLSPAFSKPDGLRRSLTMCAFSVQRELRGRELAKRAVPRSVSSGNAPPSGNESEEVYFDGGVHYGDLVANLLFGLTLVWLPLTLAAVFRGLFLRYRFTNLRVTIQSGLLGDDRKDFSYDVIKEVRSVPRLIGEWGDMAIELKDGTKVDIRCVPKFREIANYIEERVAAASDKRKKGLDPSILSSTTSKKGFS